MLRDYVLALFIVIVLGVVTGDDLLPRLDALMAEGHALANMDTGEPLSLVRDRVLSANAYIGSDPIVEALGKGANIVITGRSTDTALTMAPLRYEFGWGAGDWDKMAAGIIAGHIIECGAQSTGAGGHRGRTGGARTRRQGVPAGAAARAGEQRRFPRSDARDRYPERLEQAGQVHRRGFAIEPPVGVSVVRRAGSAGYCSFSHPSSWPLRELQPAVNC